ncbi:putative uncharacterized protein DDB_G0286901 isoform X2 [Wyeomyia smithii]|nr:putative uncharacterized protein DDB_G0286901 isoform X2 [Wyeomyia smithii]
MALNIAVPLATVGDLMDGFGLLSPISPLSVDCRSVTAAGSHGKKQLVSPVGSESSGVSSLDSEEIKKPSSPSTTPTEELERPSVGSPAPPSEESKPEVAETEDGCSTYPSSACPSSSSPSSMRSSLSSTDSISDEPGSSNEETVEPTVLEREPKIVLSGRNVLDLIDNLTAPGYFRLQFAQLPENDNIHFFLDNRSQYHRLGANGHIQEYTMVKCRCCDFSYPMNGTSPANATAAIGTAAMAGFNQTSNLTSGAFQQQQQQQQQQQLQWNSFNSIANSRDKMNMNVAANAFNKAFTTGTGNGNGNSNNGGSQYFRNGNIAAGLFGRDSNRNNGGNNFLNSTSTYNNHKSYQQQSFGIPNNNGSKFNNPYGQLQQQQQPFYSKNHSLRYGAGGNNNTGGAGQSTSSTSNGFNSSAVAAAAAALASQNILNFNSFNNSNNSFNNNKSNSNNMFAYYKTMM